jgi:hypothetical protein
VNLRTLVLLSLLGSSAALLLALAALALTLAVMRQSATALKAVRQLERRHHNTGPPPGTPERRRHPDDTATSHTPAHYQRPAVPPTDRERTTP